jgi:hypothetical protein
MASPSKAEEAQVHDVELEATATETLEKPGPGLEGMALNDVLPDLGKPWWKVPYLLKLNILLLGALLTPATNGFDGSMLNGLQTLPVWQRGRYRCLGTESRF